MFFIFITLLIFLSVNSYACWTISDWNYYCPSGCGTFVNGQYNQDFLNHNTWEEMNGVSLCGIDGGNFDVVISSGCHTEMGYVSSGTSHSTCPGVAPSCVGPPQHPEIQYPLMIWGNFKVCNNDSGFCGCGWWGRYDMTRTFTGDPCHVGSCGTGCKFDESQCTCVLDDAGCDPLKCMIPSVTSDECSCGCPVGSSLDAGPPEQCLPDDSDAVLNQSKCLVCLYYGPSGSCEKYWYNGDIPDWYDMAYKNSPPQESLQYGISADVSLDYSRWYCGDGPPDYGIYHQLPLTGNIYTFDEMWNFLQSYKDEGFTCPKSCLTICDGPNEETDCYDVCGYYVSQEFQPVQTGACEGLQCNIEQEGWIAMLNGDTCMVDLSGFNLLIDSIAEKFPFSLIFWGKELFDQMESITPTPLVFTLPIFGTFDVPGLNIEVFRNLFLVVFCLGLLRTVINKIF